MLLTYMLSHNLHLVFCLVDKLLGLGVDTVLQTLWNDERLSPSVTDVLSSLCLLFDFRQPSCGFIKHFYMDVVPNCLHLMLIPCICTLELKDVGK